jgi:hypothetical protein
LTDRPRVALRKAANQFLKEKAGLIIDHIAVIATSASTLRDIVASRLGVRQKPRTTIAPNKAIRIQKTTLWSNALISLS